jgi:hypothetical protein
LINTVPNYYLDANKKFEWYPVVMEVGRKVGDEKLVYCMKLPAGGRAEGVRPQKAIVTSPWTVLLNPQGPLWGNWLNPNPKVQENQFKPAPTKAKYKVPVSVLKWDPQTTNAKGEDPFTADFIDNFYVNEVERKGFEALVKYNIIDKGDISMYDEAWEEAKKAGKTDKPREVFIVDKLLAANKFERGVWIGKFNDKGQPDEKNGKERPSSRRLTFSRPVCHPQYPDKYGKEKQMTENGFDMAHDGLPLVTDPAVLKILGDISKQHSEDGKQMQYEPLKVFTVKNQRFPLEKSGLKTGDVCSLRVSFAMVKNPNSAKWMCQKRLEMVFVLRQGKHVSQDAVAAAAMKEAAFEGGDDFDFSDEFSSSSSNPLQGSSSTSAPLAMDADAFGLSSSDKTNGNHHQPAEMETTDTLPD